MNVDAVNEARKERDKQRRQHSNMSSLSINQHRQRNVHSNMSSSSIDQDRQRHVHSNMSSSSIDEHRQRNVHSNMSSSSIDEHRQRNVHSNMSSSSIDEHRQRNVHSNMSSSSIDEHRQRNVHSNMSSSSIDEHRQRNVHSNMSSSSIDEHRQRNVHSNMSSSSIDQDQQRHVHSNMSSLSINQHRQRNVHSNMSSSSIDEHRQRNVHSNMSSSSIDEHRQRNVHSNMSSLSINQDRQRHVHSNMSSLSIHQDRQRHVRNSQNSSSSIESISPVNYDAKKFYEQSNKLLQFEICAICAIEDWDMEKLDSYKTAIEKSDLKKYYNRKIELLIDITTTPQEKAFIQDLIDHVPNGILKNATHICSPCAKCFVNKKKGDNIEADTTSSNSTSTCNNTGFPKYALIRGLYPGCIPKELAELNYIERSMISINSCISRVKVLSGTHYKKCGTGYTIVNDLVKVMEFLPRVMTTDQFAVLRHHSETTSRDYKFNPKKVWWALQWLKKNNHLYKDIEIASVDYWPEEWRPPASEFTIDEVDTDLQNVAYINLSDDDVTDLDAECENTIAAGSRESAEPLEIQQEKEVFLYSEHDIRTHEETLTNILSPGDFFKSNEALAVLNATATHEFVNPIRDPAYFWAKCFPCLYPYGYGCPSDPNSKLNNLRCHSKHMLMRGGGPQGRRFQQCPNWYFAIYHYESRRKIGGIVSKAENSKFDGLSEEDDTFINATVLSRMKKFAEDHQIQHQSSSDESNADCMDTIENEVIFESTSSSSSSSSFSQPAVLPQNDEVSSTPITVGTIPKMTKEEFEFYAKRLSVYGKSLPGTSLHMKTERNNLMSMIASPTVENEGIFRWFITLSPADLYDPRLFEILAASDEEFLDWENRKVKARSLSKEKRIDLLSLHPALYARLFELQMQCYWDYVIDGSAAPLGRVVDFFRRVEFQLRGTPHYHMLVSVKHDGIDRTYINSDSKDTQYKVIELVKDVVTSNLVSPSDDESLIHPYEFHSYIENENHPTEESQENQDSYEFTPWEYEYQPGKKKKRTYFPDDKNPCRDHFDPNLDYTRNSSTGEFNDCNVQNKFRNYQIANQMHKHTFSCFKYCRPCGVLICRHNFPYKMDDLTNANEPVIQASYDRRKRRKINVLPPRNNAWLNTTFFNPLLTLAHAGNHDCQYISNTVGAAEYTGCYVSKTDQADFNLVCNLIYKKLNQEWSSNSDLNRLKSVGNAILDSTPIGSVECMYSLLGLQFVKKSRVIENANALERCKMSKDLELDNERLERMDVDEEPVKKGINSHFGKREAYEKLNKYMWTTFNECNISFYAMLANFTVTQPQQSKKQYLKPSCLITLDDAGSVINNGNLDKFSIDNIVYTRRKKNAVINLCPYIPTDMTDETSCYAILLLHVPWPQQGEKYIKGENSAVQQLQLLLNKENENPGFTFLKYVNPLLQRIETSQSLFENNIHADDRHDNEDDFRVIDNDDDEESVIIQDHEIIANMNFDDLYINPIIASMSETNSSDGHDARRDLTADEISGYREYIKRKLSEQKKVIRSLNQIQKNDEDTTYSNFPFLDESFQFQKIYPYKDDKIRIKQLDENMKWLINPDNALNNKLQHSCLITIFKHLAYPDSSNKLDMFLTGEGGTGKSEIIKYATEFGRLFFGKQEGIYGPVLNMAQTGTAATNIDGHTWQSVLGKGFSNSTISNNTAQEVGKRISGVKLVIIDEISLTSLEDLNDIHERLVAAILSTISSGERELREEIRTKLFGGLHVLLVGDFYQLPPCKGYAMYTREQNIKLNSKARKGYELWNRLSSFVELIDNMRMHSATEEGKKFIETCSKLRKGEIALSNDEYLDFLNQRVIIGLESIEIKNAGESALWIANTNDAVNFLNERQFNVLSQQKFNIRIIANHIPIHSDNAMPNEDTRKELFNLNKRRNKLYKTATHLDLCIGSKVMLTRNLGTEINLVNGSVGIIKGFGFAKTDNQQPQNGDLPDPSVFYKIIPSKSYPIVFVEFPSMKVDGLTFDENDTIKKTVPISFVESQNETYKVDTVSYKRLQLPLMPAAAITTHKSQGATAKDGVIYKPTDLSKTNRPFARGLEYVAISRCPAFSKLYLLQPLQSRHFTSYNNNQMIDINNFYDKLRNK